MEQSVPGPPNVLPSSTILTIASSAFITRMRTQTIRDQKRIVWKNVSIIIMTSSRFKKHRQTTLTAMILVVAYYSSKPIANSCVYASLPSPALCDTVCSPEAFQGIEIKYTTLPRSGWRLGSFLLLSVTYLVPSHLAGLNKPEGGEDVCHLAQRLYSRLIRIWMSLCAAFPHCSICLLHLDSDARATSYQDRDRTHISLSV